MNERKEVNSLNNIVWFVLPFFPFAHHQWFLTLHRNLCLQPKFMLTFLYGNAMQVINVSCAVTYLAIRSS